MSDLTFLLKGDGDPSPEEIPKDSGIQETLVTCFHSNIKNFILHIHAKYQGALQLELAGPNPNKVVIVGGGFGGLEAARQLRDAPCDVLLIDKLNHHLFQPLLYQVASAALSPGDIAQPLRRILYKQKNCQVLMATVTEVNKEGQYAVLEDGTKISYNTLILAPGARHSYFQHPEWEKVAPGLKTIQDALKIREKILSAFERAERTTNQAARNAEMTFVVVGGGPTGVEMAGSIAEIALNTIVHDYSAIDTRKAKIYLIEGAPHILPTYPLRLSVKAEKALEKMGVTLLCNSFVTDVTDEGLFVGERCIPTKSIIWAAGNRASPLLQTLQIPLDKAGRVAVKPDLSIEDWPNIFVIGDAALALDKEGAPLPGLAPVAKQQGGYVALQIKQKLKNKPPLPPFRYFDKGSLATIGRGKAVGKVGRRELSGVLAWFAWSFIHVWYLIGFENRLLVMIKWIFWYCSSRRNVQLITNPLKTKSYKQNK